MKSGIRVADVMTRKFISTSPNTHVIDCLKVMSRMDFGSLLIMQNKKLVGIITDKDIIEAIAKNKKIMEKPIKTIMTKNIVTISPTKDISEAILLMNKKNIKRLPVNVKKNIIGLVTEKDILKIRPGLFDIIVQKKRILEEKEKIKRIKTVNEYRAIKEGMCEECGAPDMLYQVNDRAVCHICRETVKKQKPKSNQKQDKNQPAFHKRVITFLRRKHE